MIWALAAVLVSCGLVVAFGERLWRRAKFARRFWRLYRHARTPAAQSDARFEWSIFVWCILAEILLVGTWLASVIVAFLWLSGGVR